MYHWSTYFEEVTWSAESNRVPSVLNVNDAIQFLWTITLSSRRLDPFHIINSPSKENRFRLLRLRVNRSFPCSYLKSQSLRSSSQDAMPCNRHCSSVVYERLRRVHPDRKYVSSRWFIRLSMNTYIFSIEKYIGTDIHWARRKYIQRWMPFH